MKLVTQKLINSNLFYVNIKKKVQCRLEELFFEIIASSLKFCIENNHQIGKKTYKIENRKKNVFSYKNVLRT